MEIIKYPKFEENCEKMCELVDYCKRFGNLKENELEPDEESESESEE